MDGRIVNVAIAATAGNVVSDISPGRANRRWKVNRLWIQVVCDATVANRNIIVRQYLAAAGTVQGPSIVGATAVALGTTRLAMGVEQLGSGATFEYEANVVLPQPIILDGFNSLNIRISGGVAGDSYTANANVEEMAAL